MSKLFKAEVPLVMAHVVRFLGNHNPEALHLGDLYALLVPQLEKSKVLAVPYGKHHLTYQLAKLHTKRLKYAALINLQLKSLEKLDCEKTQRMVRDAQKLSKDFLTYLGQKRIRVVTFQIDVFFSQLRLDNNTDSREAFIELGLQRYLDELRKTNELHYDLFNERQSDIDGRPQTQDRLLEKETQNMMRLFFEQVNSYQRTFKDIDYYPLICQINIVLTRYSKLLKTRVATNKRKVRKKKALAAKAAAEKELKAQKITEAKTETKPATNSVTIAKTSVEAMPMTVNSVVTTTNSALKRKKGKRKRRK